MEVTGGLHQQEIEFTGSLSSVSIQSGSQPQYGVLLLMVIFSNLTTQNLDFV